MQYGTYSAESNNKENNANNYLLLYTVPVTMDWRLTTTATAIPHSIHLATGKQH